MNQSFDIPTIFQIAITLLTLFYPFFAILKNDEGIKGKDFVKQYPQYKWIQRFHLPLYISWILFILTIQFLVVVKQSPIQSFFSMGTTYALIGGFFGFFALITNVLVIPYGRYQNFYIGSKALQVAKTHVVICMGVIIINSIIQFILTR